MKTKWEGRIFSKKIVITHHQMALESRKYHHSTQIENYIELYPQIFFEKNRPSHFVFILPLKLESIFRYSCVKPSAFPSVPKKFLQLQFSFYFHLQDALKRQGPNFLLNFDYGIIFMISESSQNFLQHCEKNYLVQVLTATACALKKLILANFEKT